MTRRFRLDLEYDGALFAGWQRQADERTVQGELEEALAPLCGHEVAVVGAGRTDAGVHALGQVAHFDSGASRGAEVYLRALNATTSRGLTVLSCREVASGFHARFDACYREYRYRLLDRREPPALVRGRVWHVPLPLDGVAMGEALEALRGTHDFSAFRAASCQARHPVRTVSRVEVVREVSEWHVVLGANAFLHHMVRNIVGSLVEVGRGRWSVARFREVLEGRDRLKAGPTAPPEGLYLERVGYPGDDFLPGSDG